MNDVDLNTEIAEVAAELYKKSGRIEGRDLYNWLEAERIVIARCKEKEKLEAKKLAPKKRESITKTSAKKSVTKKTKA